jgi:hypothetical protein
MAAVAEETTLIEVEATVVTIVPIMAMEEESYKGIGGRSGAEAGVTVVHTTVVVRLAVEMLRWRAQRLTAGIAVGHWCGNGGRSVQKLVV